MYSKKILRHFKKAFNTEDLDTLLAPAEKVLSGNPSPEVAEAFTPLLGIRQFIESANRAYVEYDDRLVAASRNIDISSSELSKSNKELFKLNTSVNTMINSLAEGYFLINSEGLCEGIYSKICEDIFGGSPVGVRFVDLINMPSEEHETIEQWLTLIFAGRLRIEDITELGPQSFVNKKDQVFSLHFRLISGDTGVQNLVVVASDKTAETKANEMAQNKVVEGKTIVKLVQDKEHFRGFVNTCQEILACIQEASGKEEDWNQIRFDLHTLKGGAATFYMSDMEKYLHECELEIKAALETDLLPEFSPQQLVAEVNEQLNSFISKFQRVLGSPDSWMNEVVLNRQKILSLIQHGEKAQVPKEFLERLVFETMGIDLQDVFAGYRSTVQITASRLSKSIGPLQIQGPPLRVLIQPYRKLFASMVHLIRNAVDHGIEGEEQRLASGKPPVGTITIRYGMTAKDKKWWFEVSDDGAGVDCEALRKRLIEKEGPHAAQFTNEEILMRLLKLSVSSKTTQDETSGMGVGLVAVDQAVTELKGHYRVESTLGKGTRFYFELPWISCCDIIKSSAQAA